MHTAHHCCLSPLSYLFKYTNVIQFVSFQIMYEVGQCFFCPVSRNETYGHVINPQSVYYGMHGPLHCLFSPRPPPRLDLGQGFHYRELKAGLSPRLCYL